MAIGFSTIYPPNQLEKGHPHFNVWMSKIFRFLKYMAAQNLHIPLILFNLLKRQNARRDPLRDPITTLRYCLVTPIVFL